MQNAAAVLAMDGIGLVAVEAAVGTLKDHARWPEDGLNEPQKERDTQQ